MAIDAPPAAPSPFQVWQHARTAQKDAERRGADHPDILQLSAEVIRTRNLVTADRVRAGWQRPDDILKHLTVDEQLLREHDDAGLP